MSAHQAVTDPIWFTCTLYAEMTNILNIKHRFCKWIINAHVFPQLMLIQ